MNKELIALFKKHLKELSDALPDVPCEQAQRLTMEVHYTNSCMVILVGSYYHQRTKKYRDSAFIFYDDNNKDIEEQFQKALKILKNIKKL